MNPLQSLIGPEREAPGPRRAPRSTDAEGFDNEIRGAEKRATKAAEMPGEAGEQGTDERAEGQGEEPAPIANADGRAMAGLLQALSKIRADPANAPASPADGADDALAKVDPEAAFGAGSSIAETAEADKSPRVRLKLVHQETHFEPTSREAVLVDRDGAEPGQEKAGRDLSLSQLLDAGSSRKTSPGEASVAAAAARPAIESAGAERRVLRTDAIVQTSLAARAATLSNVSPDSAPATAGDEAGLDTATDDAQSESGIVPPARRDRQVERGVVRDGLLAAASERQPPRESVAEPARAVPGSGTVLTGATGQSLSTQIAGRIVDAFAGTSTLQRPDAPNLETHLRLRAGGSVLKTLTIQLQPEHLGTLNVSMRLKEGQLMLEMAASRAETAMLLTQDRPALKALLEKAGFSLDEAAIVVVARDAVQSTNALARETGTGGSETGRGGGEAAGGDRGAQRESFPERRASTPDVARKADAAERAGAGAVFL